MALSLKELAQTDFSGGLNAVTSPFRLSPRQIYRVRNLMLDEHGSLRTRPGYAVLTTSPQTTAPITHLNVLNLTNGTSYPLAVQNNALAIEAEYGSGVYGSSSYAGTFVGNTVYRTDTTPWTTIGTTMSAYEIPDSVTVLDRQVFAMGYESPWVWDGSTFTQITAEDGQSLPTGAKHVAFHLGSLWLWNTAAVTTTLDGPSSLRMSDANSTGSWPLANQTFVSRDDGQVGMGMATFTIVETGISPTASLILFKNYSAYQVAGVFGASNFSVQKIKSDMGCVAPRTIQFCSGFGIIRFSHKGFALYNGVDDRLISEEIRPYLFGTDELSGVNWTMIERGWAVQSQNPPLYIAVLPTDSTTPDRLFIYDLVRKAWTIGDLPIGVQTAYLHTTATTQPMVRGGRASTGQVVRLFDPDDTTDNGSQIAWSFRSRNYFMGSYLRPSFWRRFLLDLLYSPTQAASVTTELGGLTSTLSASASFTGTVSYSRYGMANYGNANATYGHGLSGTLDGRQSVDILRTAPYVSVTVSGSGNVRIRGLSFHVAAKPLTQLRTARPV